MMPPKDAGLVFAVVHEHINSGKEWNTTAVIKIKRKTNVGHEYVRRVYSIITKGIPEIEEAVTGSKLALEFAMFLSSKFNRDDQKKLLPELFSMGFNDKRNFLYKEAKLHNTKNVSRSPKAKGLKRKPTHKKLLIYNLNQLLKLILELEDEIAKSKFVVCMPTIAIVTYEIRKFVRANKFQVDDSKAFNEIIKGLTTQAQANNYTVSINALTDLINRLKDLATKIEGDVTYAKRS